MTEPITISIGGFAVPVATFEAAANAVINGVKAGEAKESILAAMAPDVLSMAEMLAGALIPYGGAIVELLAFAYSKSIPFKDLSQDEQNAWFDRFGIGGDA